MASHPQIASTDGGDERAITRSRAASSQDMGQWTLDASPAEGSLAQPDPTGDRDATDTGYCRSQGGVGQRSRHAARGASADSVRLRRERV